MTRSISHLQPMIDLFHTEIGRSSINFTITVSIPQPHGTAYEAFFRDNQPCYGELRKYKSVHGEQATQNEHKPSDLYSPFPFYGTPCGVTAGFDLGEGGDKSMQEFMTYMLCKSPYSKTFGKVSTRLLKNRYFVLSWDDGEFDPTAAVNMLTHIRAAKWGSSVKVWEECIKGGMSEDDALFTILFLTNPLGSKAGIGSVSGYISTSKPSYKNFIAGNCNKKLSNGLFKERKDYNRKDMHDVWLDPNNPNNTMLAAYLRANLPSNYDKMNTTEKCKSLVALYQTYDPTKKEKSSKKTAKKAVVIEF